MVNNDAGFLANRFHYLNLILQDTPIYDNEYYQNLNSIFPRSDEYGYQSLSNRIKSVELFIEYLISQERNELKKIGSDDALYYSITDDIKNRSLIRDINSAKKALKYNP